MDANIRVVIIEIARPKPEPSATKCQILNSAKPGRSTNTTPAKPSSKGGKLRRLTGSRNAKNINRGTINGALLRSSVASNSEILLSAKK